MKKWVCPVCGYVYEGENPPEKCPQCGASGSRFTEQKAGMTWAAEHVIGVGKVFGADVPAEVQQEIVDGLRANFTGECTEVGMGPSHGSAEGVLPVAGTAGLVEAEAGAAIAQRPHAGQRFHQHRRAHRHGGGLPAGEQKARPHDAGMVQYAQQNVVAQVHAQRQLRQRRQRPPQRAVPVAVLLEQQEDAGRQQHGQSAGLGLKHAV